MTKYLSSYECPRQATPTVVTVIMLQ